MPEEEDDKMKLGNPPNRYDQSFETRRNTTLMQHDDQNRKKQGDVECGAGQRLILASPNGARWNIVVSNAGVISATAL